MSDAQTTAQDFPRGVPGGAEVWLVDNTHAFLAYDVPNTDPPVPLVYHVESQEDLNALFEEAGDIDVSFDRTLSSEQFRETGAIRSGSANQLRNTSKHPFETFVDTYEDEAAIRPWLKDPEMLSLAAGAILEGRAVTEAELKTTDWWRSRSAAEREWARLAASDPQEAQRQITNTRRKTRNALIQAGMSNPPESLIRYYGDRLARGEISESRWQDDIRRETDPYAPYASPFAGRRLPEGAQVHQRGDGQWMVRFNGKDYRLTGPGQKARYGAHPGMNKTRSVSGGDYFVADGQHYLRSTTDHWYRATGPGQIENLQRLYGDPVETTPDRIGEISGSVVSLFGGPGSMESYLPVAPEAGTALDMFKSFETAERERELPEGRHVVAEDGTHYFVAEDGTSYVATGPGQEQGLTDIYGPADEVSSDQIGEVAEGNSVLQLFGGPGGIEQALQGAEHTGLPGTEQVINEIHKWVGPAHAENYDRQWVERWAGKLRNEGEAAKTQLEETLKRHRQSIFPDVENPESTYEDLAQTARGLVQRVWGQRPDETADYFPELIRINDIEEQKRFLREEGRKRGVERVLDETRQAAGEAFGSQVQESVI